MTIEELESTASDQKFSDSRVEQIFFEITRNSPKEMREHALEILKKYRPTIIQYLRMWPNSHY